MKNEKRTVFRFPFFYENEKRIKVSKIQRKNVLNMKMVVSYLNFVFFIKVKAKSKYKTLNFVFQFTKKTKWHFGCTDSRYFHSSINHLEHVFSQSTYHWLLLSCEYCKVFKNGLCYRTPQEAVVCRYSSKKVFLKVSQTSQESTCGGVFF